VNPVFVGLNFRVKSRHHSH